ncbi:MAG: hypothetical protein WA924_10775, partial [Burkholderiaceae bacterium]
MRRATAMTSHLKLLAQRREQLVARCALQREAMAIQKIRIRQSLDRLESSVGILQKLRGVPGLLLLLGGGVFLLQPRRLRALLR